MKAPSADHWKLFCEAALATGVPATLLAAVAFQESGYKPEKTGAQTSEGWHAKGMMQLSPVVIEATGVTDPFDARQSINGGAMLLAQLYQDPYSRGNKQRVLGLYTWGIGRARKWGTSRPWPVSVREYADSVLRNQYWLQSQSQPLNDGQAASHPMGRLAIAYANAAALNPGIVEVQNSAKAFFELFPKEALNLIVDYNDVLIPRNAMWWLEYARIYDRIPVTSIESGLKATPRPEDIAADLWPELLKQARSGAMVVRPAPPIMASKQQPPIRAQAMVIDTDGSGTDAGQSSGMTLLIVLLAAAAVVFSQRPQY